MKISPLLIFVSLLLSGFGLEQVRPRMFQVRVESKIDGCVRRHDVMVEARNMYDARDKARRIVQHKLTTRVTNSKEIKRL